AMFVGELVELLAAAAMGRPDEVAGFTEVLLVVAEKHALSAGRAERAGVGEVRLPGMRCADLMIELGGMTAGQRGREIEVGHCDLLLDVRSARPQQAAKRRQRIDPRLPITWTLRNNQGVAPAPIEPAHFEMLATIADGGREAMLPEQRDSVVDELGGALHHDSLLALRASTSERDEWCAWA